MLGHKHSLAATQLTDAFQLVAETKEAEVIQASSSKSLCQRYWPVTRTLHQRKTVGLSHCLQDLFITFLETNRVVSLS